MKIIKVLLLVITATASISFAGIFDANDNANDGLIETGEYGSHVRVYENSILTMTGGGADTIDVKDNALLNVISTKTPLSDVYNGGGGIYDIYVNDNASLEFSGGIVKDIGVYYNATALLNGGEITFLKSIQKPSLGKTITIECQDGWQWLYDSEQQINGITGKWHNGDDFSITFLNDHLNIFPDTWTHVEVVPEPMSIGLLALGGLALNLRKRV